MLHLCHKWIYPLLLTSWQSLVHEHGIDSSKTKRLFVVLLVNKVRIRSRKRAFSKCAFSTVSRLPSYNLTTTSHVEKRKTSSLSAKGRQDNDAKTWFRYFAVNGRFMHKRSHIWVQGVFFIVLISVIFCQMGKICTLSSRHGYYECTCRKSHLGLFPTIA